MSATGSPLTPYPHASAGYQWSKNELETGAADNAVQAAQPPTESPRSMNENLTQKKAHSRSKYLTDVEQMDSAVSQPITKLGRSESLASDYRKAATLENTVPAAQPLTDMLAFSENSKLDTGLSQRTDMTTAETRAAITPRAMHGVDLSEGPKFCPTRELQMSRRGFCAQVTLLLIAVLPLLLIPVFCIFGFVELWIPKIGDEHSEAQHQPAATFGPVTELSMPGEQRTMPLTSGLVESTKAVNDPAISIYPSLVEPKGGISP
ncbi:hypothetical protein AJ78_05678 [Emergomyces pasteurianus Ep9510]|uniref:Transmembrane protein n=1 Tax=Emergomyces pasteurianus Ep9510 TaxID=1447872 RepID=A0A1J9Q161_9EURO|nr:hypothetical protein AJ78_05678 [Emergomyces pasteurianus Ep9510]